MIEHLQKLLQLLFILGISAASSLVAQTHFTAILSPAKIGKNETAELKFMIENAGEVDHFTAPSLKDFMVLSGPNQESGMENNNGVTKQYIGVTYILKPRTKGNFTIGSAVAKIDGKILKTNSVKLQVTNSATTTNQRNNNIGFGGMPGFFDEPVVREKPNKDFILKEGENVQAKIAKNIFIKLIVDKTNCYIGEPIVVTYKLYSRLKSESSITKNPYLNGFSVIDLIQAGTTAYEIEKIDGKEYNVYTLRKAQLYPLQSGAMEVEIAEVENTIHFIKNAYLKSHGANIEDAINGMPPEAMQDEKITLQTKPVIINVKPLPEPNKPETFKGAVGNFKIEAAVEKNIFSTDETGKLQVIISGSGNMELINAPEINFPDGIENFEPSLIETLNKQVVPVSGSKSYVYSFTIKKPGRYTLPPIVYSFFNVQTGKYNTVNTEPIVIVVTKGIGKKASILNKKDSKNDGDTSFILALRTHLKMVLSSALLVIGGIFFLVRNKNKKRKSLNNLKTSNKPITLENGLGFPIEKSEILSGTSNNNPLAATELMLAKKEFNGFYETLDRELKQYFSIQLGIQQPLINRKIIGFALDKTQVTISIKTQIDQLLQQVEWQLYTPISEEDKMEKIYFEAYKVVNLLLSEGSDKPNI